MEHAVVPQATRMSERKSHDVGSFDEHAVIHHLKHLLPAQAPLKDFIHHNTLHAFQEHRFSDALNMAATWFGYKTTLTVNEYRKLYQQGRIAPDVLHRVVAERKGEAAAKNWVDRLLTKRYDSTIAPRIGALRAHWKRDHRIDLDALVHATLFRVLNSYLDQGVAIWRFPVWDKGFLSSIREIQRHAYTGFLKGPRAKALLMDEGTSMEQLLELLVGDPGLYEQYLFDQHFAHPGWSGLVSVIEDDPGTLLDRRRITLKELIIFELLLEVDALDRHFPKGWEPLSKVLKHRPVQLFAELAHAEVDEVRNLWQEAFEWTYYDEALAGMLQNDRLLDSDVPIDVQGIFCIDDRSCSLRRHLEQVHPGFRTFGTPGHFGIEFYYRPEHGKFNTKVCPAPITPRYLIKEVNKQSRVGKEVHFSHRTHGLLGGMFISQTLGFWSALKLFISIFKPSSSPGTTDSFQHMDHLASLTVENRDPADREDGLQVGFTVPEMATRVDAVLKSIGLVREFASVVYVVGHGASSVNNPHYAAYDCGACSGRPGSVNARVFCHMANLPAVRDLLRAKGIDIPETTRFVGALHDTTRDEIMFYDEQELGTAHHRQHVHHVEVFQEALQANAQERARRFESVDPGSSAAEVHEQVKRRSVSLFEPRPELNHATNALCIIGRRRLSRGLFLDRRAFLNSYNPEVDPEGNYLQGMLAAAAPVCGGINLEYFFSRMDNQKLGAGTKLPHNVMGLVGVANGVEGDLRPGLPGQMVEVHDPVRLLMIVEQDPQVVLDTIRRVNATYQWFINEWIHLVVVHPTTRSLHRFRDGRFEAFQPLHGSIPHLPIGGMRLASSTENMPVTLIDAI